MHLSVKGCPGWGFRSEPGWQEAARSSGFLHGMMPCFVPRTWLSTVTFSVQLRRLPDNFTKGHWPLRCVRLVVALAALLLCPAEQCAACGLGIPCNLEEKMKSCGSAEVGSAVAVAARSGRCDSAGCCAVLYSHCRGELLSRFWLRPGCDAAGERSAGVFAAKDPATPVGGRVWSGIRKRATSGEAAVAARGCVQAAVLSSPG